MSILANRVPPQSAVAKSVRWSVLVSFISITAVGWALQWFVELSQIYLFKVAILFGFSATVIILLAAKYLTSEVFGSANCVTLARLALTALLLALIGENATCSGAWFAVVVAAFAVTLDGVDGWLARTYGNATAFGARFDLETDTLLIFTASTLVWQYGKAGPWVFAAGLMRYVFVLGGRLLPWMTQTLPGSRRRQTICVLQTLLLTVCLAPPIRPPISDIVALGGLGLLSSSFAIDIAWLARKRQRFSAE